MKNKCSKMARLALIMATMLSLTACSGWHLKKELALNKNFNAFDIVVDDQYTPLHRALRKKILANGGNVSNDAKYKLHINASSVVTPSIINTAGEIIASEVAYTLTFNLTNDAGDVLTPPQTINLTSTSSFTYKNLLSSENEENKLVYTLQQEALSYLIEFLQHYDNKTKSAS